MWIRTHGQEAQFGFSTGHGAVHLIFRGQDDAGLCAHSLAKGLSTFTKIVLIIKGNSLQWENPKR